MNFNKSEESIKDLPPANIEQLNRIYAFLTDDPRDHIVSEEGTGKQYVSYEYACGIAELGSLISATGLHFIELAQKEVEEANGNADRANRAMQKLVESFSVISRIDTKPDRDIVTAGVLAERLGVSIDYVYDLTQAGYLPVTQPHGKIKLYSFSLAESKLRELMERKPMDKLKRLSIT